VPVTVMIDDENGTSVSMMSRNVDESEFRDCGRFQRPRR